MLTALSFTDGHLAVTLSPAEQSLTITLRAGAQTWGPAPLLALEIHDRPLQRTQRFEQYRVDLLQETDHGVQVIVSEPLRRISVGLWLRLIDGELEALLAPTEIYERFPEQWRLFAVDLFPGLCQVNPDGVLVLPIGDGALCRPRGKPKLEDRFLIYLEQNRWEICSFLPAAAAHDARGGWSLLALEGDCDAECRVATDGAGRGSVGFAYSLRRHWPDPVDVVNRRTRFVPIPAQADPVHFTGKRLRRQVTEVLGKPTLAERAAASPEVAYAIKGFTMKAWHGMENEGWEMIKRDKTNPVSYQSAMTFRECEGQLARLKAAGIEYMHVIVNGYQPRGHDGLYPTRFPIDERPGGEAGFRQLIRAGQVLGYHMVVHDNFMMNVKHSPDYNAEYVVHDCYGEPLPSGWWGGGLEYPTWGLALPYERLEGHLERMHGLGLRGMYYCDYMLRPLEVNYHPRWRGPRRGYLEGQMRILQAARDQFGAVATEVGTFPAAVLCDWVVATGNRKLQPTWPLAQLVDERVPLWAYTFHGLLLHGRGGLTWSTAMQTVLFGEHVHDAFSVRPVKQSVLDERHLAQLVATYEIGVARFGYLKTQELTHWRALDDKVQETHFADGTKVVADQGAKRLWVNGQEVPCPTALQGT